MSQIIDKRQNAGKKSTVNRQRFLHRYMQQIKRAVSDAIGKRSITDINKGEKVSIPAKDIQEPHFARSNGGHVERVLPGNDQFITGDKIKRDEKNAADTGSGSASQQGEGEDDFVFELSREEFLDLYFEDLALPHLVRKELSKITTHQLVRAGISTTGIPANINIIRSMRQATGRRMASAGSYKKQLLLIEDGLRALELERQALSQASIEHASPTSLKKKAKHSSEQIMDKSALIPHDALEALEHRHKTLTEQRDALLKRIDKVPFIDTIDLRYNYHVRMPTPSTQAVMFCIMDVSGSMDEIKKDIAKRFFILLYLFLTKNYAKIDLVFIRHHTSAKEVDEQDFFYSRETGGTVVSSALELLKEIIEKRYPANAWNIYVAQASDGDNWNADSPYCQTLLANDIMPHVQYYAYIEIMPRHHQSLWERYQAVHEEYAQFAMQTINEVADIYPVFRALFQRKTG